MAAFAVSGYANTNGRSCKPFNPLLGETYEADYPDKGIRFISEKVQSCTIILFMKNCTCTCYLHESYHSFCLGESSSYDCRMSLRRSWLEILGR